MHRKLLDADYIQYYPNPKIFITWYWHPYKHHPKARRIGISGRFFSIAFCIHWPGTGKHHNGSRWQIFGRYIPEIEEM